MMTSHIQDLACLLLLAVCSHVTRVILLLAICGHVTLVSADQLDIDGARVTCNSVCTYNAGLTPAVANVKEREPKVDQAIGASQSDVICLQEIWYESSMQSILASTKKKYPHHYSAIHSSSGQLRGTTYVNPWFRMFLKPDKEDSPCTQREMSYLTTSLVSCAFVNGCVWDGLMSLGSCLKTKCGKVLKSRQLSQDCLSCAFFSMASLGMSQCTLQDNRFNNPGLMVLSKKPITKYKYVDFFPNNKLFVRRGYLQVEIEDIGTVICTHLSAHFDKYFEFDMPYTTYKQQQLVEIYKLRKFKYREHILMGDLNTGPSSSTGRHRLVGVYPENYWRLYRDYRYSAPYVTSNGQCTYCVTNPLTTKGSNHILDHVLFRGNKYVVINTKRVMDQHGLSDHFGVEVKFCKIHEIDL